MKILFCRICKKSRLLRKFTIQAFNIQNFKHTDKLKSLMNSENREIEGSFHNLFVNDVVVFIDIFLEEGLFTFYPYTKMQWPYIIKTSYSRIFIPRVFHRFDIDWPMPFDIKMSKYSWGKVGFPVYLTPAKCEE